MKEELISLYSHYRRYRPFYCFFVSSPKPKVRSRTPLHIAEADELGRQHPQFSSEEMQGEQHYYTHTCRIDIDFREGQPDACLMNILVLLSKGPSNTGRDQRFSQHEHVKSGNNTHKDKVTIRSRRSNIFICPLCGRSFRCSIYVRRATSASGIAANRRTPG